MELCDSGQQLNDAVEKASVAQILQTRRDDAIGQCFTIRHKHIWSGRLLDGMFRPVLFDLGKNLISIYRKTDTLVAEVTPATVTLDVPHQAIGISLLLEVLDSVLRIVPSAEQVPTAQTQPKLGTFRDRLLSVFLNASLARPQAMILEFAYLGFNPAGAAAFLKVRAHNDGLCILLLVFTSVSY